MPDEGRKQRAVEAVTKYKGTLTSDERIAALAARFAAQEFGWTDARTTPPIDTMLVLLKDSTLTVVRFGFRTSSGGCAIDQPLRVARRVWARSELRAARTSRAARARRKLSQK